MGQHVVFTCCLVNEEYIRIDIHKDGALLEMNSPSQLDMGEIPSVVINDLDISNMIHTLKCIQKKRNALMVKTGGKLR